MRVVVQRVSEASVVVNYQTIASIGSGLMILIGVETADTKEDADWLAKKIVQLRIFNDTKGVMNCSMTDINGEALVVSQFTLHAATKKGNRPSYIKAAKHEQATTLYNYFVEQLQGFSANPVQTGVFGADMKVSLLNDGPVTIVMDSKQKE
ncbi:MAG: D-aminoacyl-tRNA deacylase [Flavobacteriaceae bacterium]|nr:D-aminoacyl-tRNA deacylase [Flavobacteriaceae bacterium]MDG2314116.1 D-aminoacyl-tRNA deacylase [Flavobacteriaceae bacterium]